MSSTFKVAQNIVGGWDCSCKFVSCRLLVIVTLFHLVILLLLCFHYCLLIFWHCYLDTTEGQIFT